MVVTRDTDTAWPWAEYTSTDTPNRGRLWFGWGTVDGFQKHRKEGRDGAYRLRPKTVAEMELRAPRLHAASLPERLRRICTDNKFERLLHSRGSDMTDMSDKVHGLIPDPFDLIAFPETEADVAAVLNHCSVHNIAVTPFGGGSSVVHGVNPPGDDAGFTGAVCMDMMKMGRVLAVDETSGAVHVEAGCYGPALEAVLKARGLTLRYYPQSFEFSTVGGWVATRGGGHFATHLTHIDDLVEAVRLVTPAGTTQTLRVPASGAGPSELRHYIGSEGIYGVITSAWLRVRPRPVYRVNATVLFSGGDAPANTPRNRRGFVQGAAAVRDVAQCGLYPSNLRLVDGVEIAHVTGVRAVAAASVLLIGFESDQRGDLRRDMDHVLTICKRHGGVVQNVKESAPKAPGAGAPSKGARDGVAGAWGTGFMAGGYHATEAVLAGVLVNTFETAITWEKFPAFYADVNATVERVLQERCGGGRVTCRFTHVYPDGPAPYFTIMAPNPGDVEVYDDRVAQWLAVKAAATEVMVRHGATSTHHHAVGRLHRGHFERESGALFARSLTALKDVHDPAWVLNPDVLVKRPGHKCAKL